MSLLKLYGRLAKRAHQTTYARMKEDIYDIFIKPDFKYQLNIKIQDKKLETPEDKIEFTEEFRPGFRKYWLLRRAGIFPEPYEAHFEHGFDYEGEQKSSQIPTTKTQINATIVGQKNILFDQASHDYLHGPHISN